MTGETFIDDDGKRVVNVHAETADCHKHGCCIHHPTDHPLAQAKRVWREAGPWDIKPAHMERVCEHGVGHPDPDGLAFLRRTGQEELARSLSIHGCDGCCSGHGPQDPAVGEIGPRQRLSPLASRRA